LRPVHIPRETLNAYDPSGACRLRTRRNPRNRSAGRPCQRRSRRCDVLNDFLNDTQIAALNNLNVPITVQVPIGIAANVCDVSANVLAQQAKNGGATCTAESGSQALAQSVNRQLLKQKR
jgi:hypothetical protein